MIYFKRKKFTAALTLLMYFVVTIIFPTISYSSSLLGLEEIKLTKSNLNFNDSHYVPDEVVYVDGAKYSESKLVAEIFERYRAEWIGEERDHDLEVYSGDGCNATVCALVTTVYDGWQEETRIDYHLTMSSGSAGSTSNSTYSASSSHSASETDTSGERSRLDRLVGSLDGLNSRISSIASDISDTNEALGTLNRSHAKAKSSLASKENTRRSALNNFNSSVRNKNSAAAESNKAKQDASNARIEANRQNAAVEDQKTRKSDNILALGKLKTQVTEKLSLSDNYSGRLDNKITDLSTQTERVGDEIDDVILRHNSLSNTIQSNLGIEAAIEYLDIDYDELIRTPNDLIVPLLPNGEEIKTKPDNPNYSKLVDAINLRDSMKSKVENLNSEQVQHAFDLNEIGIVMADEAYSKGNDVEGDEFLEGSLVVLDSIMDFVPGVSFIKDVTSIVTGINPITGEEVSDTERAIMMGTLLAPAALSGATKVTTKIAKALKKISDKGGDSGNKADDLIGVISRSDSDLKKFADVPCATVSKVEVNHSFSELNRLFVFSIISGFSAEAYANTDTPCAVGATVDAVVEGYNIVSKEFKAGSKFNWNKELNKPEPNSIYKVSNNRYQTDSLGRTKFVSMEDLKYNPAARHGDNQRKAGGVDRKETDVGGHLLGSQFGGAGEKINLVAMDKTLNSTKHDGGVFGRLESKWRDEIDNNSKVDVEIRLHYDGSSLRPSRFDVEYTVDGIVSTMRINNQPGG